MKNIFFILLIFVNISIFSQEVEAINSVQLKKHEFRIDPLKLIINRRLNITYEFFLTKKISFGLSGTFLTDPNKLENYREDKDYNILFLNKYQIIPNIRYSYGILNNSLFYIEFFSSINGGDYRNLVRIDEQNSAYYDVVDKKYTNTALGGSLGWKIYLKSGFNIDTFVGVGGNLASNKGARTISRVGINLGYRF